MNYHFQKIFLITGIRINNHEHTDVQEYLGSYVVNDEGIFISNELMFSVKISVILGFDNERIFHDQS